MFWLVKPDQTFHHFIYYRNDWTNLLRVIENTASAIFFLYAYCMVQFKVKDSFLMFKT